MNRTKIKQQLRSAGIRIVAGKIKLSDAVRFVEAAPAYDTSILVESAVTASKEPSLLQALKEFERSSRVSWRDAFKEAAIGDSESDMLDHLDSAEALTKYLKMKIKPEKSFDELSKWFKNVSMEQADVVSKKLWGSSLSNFLFELLGEDQRARGNNTSCSNCGWSGPESRLLDDIYEEGEGHMYCPECESSI